MNIITITLTAILCLIAFLFLIKNKVIAGLGWLSRILFPTLFIVALSAIFVPQVYNLIANFTLRQTGVLTSIRKVDNNIDPVGEAKDSILDELDNIFSDKDEDKKEEKEGFLEESFYPQLVAGLSYLYRLIALIVSILGMVVLIYLSLVTGTVSENERLKGRIKKIEERLDNMQ